jgi:hypothetical protein
LTLSIQLQKERSATITGPIRAGVAFDYTRGIETALIELRRSGLQILI